jgi:putative sigma-54 modulation protein
MRIDVVGKHLDVTPAIRTHAESKAEKLPRYYDGVQQITFTLARADHLRKGDFQVELVIDVEKHDDFVCHAQDQDLYVAIDAAVAKGVRQLTDFKEKLKLGKK